MQNVDSVHSHKMSLSKIAPDATFWNQASGARQTPARCQPDAEFWNQASGARFQNFASDARQAPARRNVSKSGVRRNISKSSARRNILWPCVRRAVRVQLCTFESCLSACKVDVQHIFEFEFIWTMCWKWILAIYLIKMAISRALQDGPDPIYVCPHKLLSILGGTTLHCSQAYTSKRHILIQVCVYQIC